VSVSSKGWIRYKQGRHDSSVDISDSRMDVQVSTNPQRGTVLADTLDCGMEMDGLALVVPSEIEAPASTIAQTMCYKMNLNGTSIHSLMNLNGTSIHSLRA